MGLGLGMDLLSLSPRERCCRLHRLHYSIQQTRNRGVDDAEADAVHLFVRCVSRTDNKRTPGIAASLLFRNNTEQHFKGFTENNQIKT